MEDFNQEIKFEFEAQLNENMKCDINERIINVFKAYSKKIGIYLNSLYFLYNGDKINDFEKIFDQIISKDNKINKKIKILVYKINEDNDKMNVYFSEVDTINRLTCSKNEAIKNVCERYENDLNFKHSSKIYKHEGIELDLDKIFADCNNSKNDIFIKVYPKALIIIIFAYLDFI